jgi:hypothetical protein
MFLEGPAACLLLLDWFATNCCSANDTHHLRKELSIYDQLRTRALGHFEGWKAASSPPSEFPLLALPYYQGKKDIVCVEIHYRV